jgi:hypothetical protein
MAPSECPLFIGESKARIRCNNLVKVSHNFLHCLITPYFDYSISTMQRHKKTYFENIHKFKCYKFNF